MKDDRLKSWITENKEAFEEDFNAESNWSRIEEGLAPPVKMVRLRTVIQWGVAAALVISLGVSVLLNMIHREQEVLAEVPAKETIQPMDLSALGGELAEAEGYYISQVNLCMSQLADFEVDEDMMADVQMLQEEYENLKKELGRGADKEKIIAAMIENYRFRLEILENILQELNEKNHDDEQVMA